MIQERVTAYRIDEEHRRMSVVEVDEFANWQSEENGVIVTHIEGIVGDDQEGDGIKLCVKYDFCRPYPYPLPENGYVSGRLPPRERLNLLILKSGEELLGGLLVYDSRRGDYPYPIDEKGEPLVISLN